VSAFIYFTMFVELFFIFLFVVIIYELFMIRNVDREGLHAVEHRGDLMNDADVCAMLECLVLILTLLLCYVMFVVSMLFLRGSFSEREALLSATL